MIKYEESMTLLVSAIILDLFADYQNKYKEYMKGEISYESLESYRTYLLSSWIVDYINIPWEEYFDKIEYNCSLGKPIPFKLVY